MTLLLWTNNRKSNTTRRLNGRFKYTEKNLFRILHKSEFTKIATHSLHKFKRISYGHQYAKIAKPIYEENTPLCLRKTHGTRTLSVWLSWFDNVQQYTEVAESNVLQYIVKPIWPYRESTGAVRFSQAEWCAFFVFFYTNIT